MNSNVAPAFTRRVSVSPRSLCNALIEDPRLSSAFTAVSLCHPETTPEALVELVYTLAADNPWLQRADVGRAKNIILDFNALASNVAQPFRRQRLDWPLRQEYVQATDFDLSPIFNKIDEETSRFIAERNLTPSVAWLRAAAPLFFAGADFEITVLPADSGEEHLLALKVYAAFSASEFRNLRHQICAAMVAAGHGDLYEKISIFQRSVNGNGRQVFSWYGALSV